MKTEAHTYPASATLAPGRTSAPDRQTEKNLQNFHSCQMERRRDRYVSARTKTIFTRLRRSPQRTLPATVTAESICLRWQQNVSCLYCGILQ